MRDEREPVLWAFYLPSGGPVQPRSDVHGPAFSHRCRYQLIVSNTPCSRATCGSQPRRVLALVISGWRRVGSSSNKSGRYSIREALPASEITSFANSTMV